MQETLLEMERKRINQSLSDKEFERLLEKFCLKYSASFEEVIQLIEREIKPKR